MTSVSSFQNAYIRDWLIRVNAQYDKDTPKKVADADQKRAKESFRLGNVTNNYFFSSPQPAACRAWFSGDTNSHNTTFVDKSTHIYNTASVDASSESEDKDNEGVNKKKQKTKEEKPDWKGIAAIGVVSTFVAGGALFFYARLSKAVEGAVNYLENTTRIKHWSETSVSSDSNIKQIAQIADVQLKIEQRFVDKIKNYKYSILTILVGTLAIVGGGITILASAPALATAGKTVLIAGIVLDLIAAMYAAYNCGMHWSDEEEGKTEFNRVKDLIPPLIKVFNPNITQPQNSSRNDGPPYYSQQPSEAPPSYEESELDKAILNQRTTGMYPNVSGFAPSAPFLERK